MAILKKINEEGDIYTIYKNDESGDVEKVIIDCAKRDNPNIKSKIVKNLKLQIQITPMDKFEEERFYRVFTELLLEKSDAVC